MKEDALPGVVMVGCFPPPVHGMAVVNEAVRETVSQRGSLRLVINLAGESLNRSFAARFRRSARVLVGLAKFVAKRSVRHEAFYMSVSGGFGQIYEIVFVLIARVRGMRVFLHHHSAAYLDKPTALAGVLVRLAGNDAVHITQCWGLAERLQASYGVVRPLPLSNAVFLGNRMRSGRSFRRSVRTLGFISNIAPEKGIFEFLELMAAVDAARLPLRAMLAGPFQDEDTEKKVMDRLRSFANVEYVGAKYGAAKDAYYAAIDVLVFPTRYSNEAEGIVNHEAMSHGIPVIAYGRGCIPELIDSESGLVIHPSERFVPAALDQLKFWLVDRAAFQAASKAAAARFDNYYDENHERWGKLLEDIVGERGRSGGECEGRL